MMNCPLCQTSLIQKISTHFYDCLVCRALVREETSLLSPDDEKTQYELHNNDVNDKRYQEFTSPITAHILEHFTEKDKGLDFGCGPGPVIASMLKDRNYDISLYDPFFSSGKESLARKYDYIACCEVFEHFYRPGEELRRLSGLLKPDGELLIMTLLYHDDIDFNSWSYPRDPTHVILYRKETFNYITETMHLRIIFMKNRFICLRKNG